MLIQLLKIIALLTVPMAIIKIQKIINVIHAKRNANFVQVQKYAIAALKNLIILVKQMNYLFNIGEQHIKELSKYDQRSYDYNPIN